jgi:GTPase SAR1 family protein
MKILNLGVTGSGKTSFMYELINRLVARKNETGFNISPKNDNSSERDRIDAISEFSSNYIGRKGQWYKGTPGIEEYRFSFEYNSEEITEFKWVDYRGGSISDYLNKQINKNDLDVIFDQMKLSNSIIITCDSICLQYYSLKNSNRDVAREHTGALDINLLFMEYLKRYPHNKISILIVLTKSDAVSSDWRNDNFKLLIDSAECNYDYIIELSKINGWPCSIIPVSVVGFGNVTTQIMEPVNFNDPLIVENVITNRPNSYNVENSLYWCIGNVLNQVKIKTDIDVFEFESKLMNSEKNINFFNDILCFFKNEKSAREHRDDINNFISKRKKLVSKFENHIAGLIKQAENAAVKMV